MPTALNPARATRKFLRPAPRRCLLQIGETATGYRNHALESIDCKARRQALAVLLDAGCLFCVTQSRCAALLGVGNRLDSAAFSRLIRPVPLSFCGARFSVPWWHSCHHLLDVGMNPAAARSSETPFSCNKIRTLFFEGQRANSAPWPLVEGGLIPIPTAQAPSDR